VHDLRHDPDAPEGGMIVSGTGSADLTGGVFFRDTSDTPVTFDLRTPDQRLSDEITALRLELQRLADVVDVQARRLERLERARG
jgi:hypothetical protein